ncbi:LEM domain-containing protein 1 isoform X1 [Dendropsophus ebraccatus]|uniref:LEM domain-containing protein 1 isoform X1 n=1 Tax=Dendropsophus ebraccatus TaxID=150705 RepID=UPI0038310351
MPTLTGTPSHYSKDQLKNLLISHNVPLPPGDQRKAVYLQLYLKHILPKDKEAADFSSDDEDVLSENDLQPAEDHEEERRDNMDLKSLSDSELKEQLRKHGVNPGPILPTTRTIYEKKLHQLLEEKQVKANGGGHEEQYSDSEDEGFQVKNLVLTGCELNGDRVHGTHGFDSYSQNNMERRSSLGQTAGNQNGQESKNLASKSQEKLTSDKNTMTYRSPANTPKACVFTKQSRLQEEDASRDDFSDLLSPSSLGLMATRRKPIKGAAGRPIQFRYDDVATRARMQEQTKETVTEGKPQRLVSVRLQIVIFIIVAFIALVYITMESSPENPFNRVPADPAESQQP